MMHTIENGFIREENPLAALTLRNVLSPWSTLNQLSLILNHKAVEQILQII